MFGAGPDVSQQKLRSDAPNVIPTLDTDDKELTQRNVVRVFMEVGSLADFRSVSEVVSQGKIVYHASKLWGRSSFRGPWPD